MALVKFTSALKRFEPELTDINLPGDTVGSILSKVAERYPKLNSYIIDEKGSLRKHVNIFVQGKMIADRENLSDPVAENDELFIIQALSGG